MITSIYNEKEGKESLLLRQFRDFYKEVIIQKEMIYDSSARTGDDIRNRFAEILKNQEFEAHEYGKGYGLSFYKEVKYVMTALADDVFINDIAWRDSEDWKDDSLEVRFFNTNFAGDHFFDKIDVLLKNADPVSAEIAAVYFLALSLGFKGKYRKRPDSDDLRQYKERLFRFIFHKNPDSEGERLFPQTYQNNLTEAGNRRFSYLKLWAYGIAGSFLGLLILSYIVWSSMTGDLMQIVDSIGKTMG
ncbi:MAG TPA: hypothetical protein DCQ37_18720 [Desulfobacteraceae bacterium]|nr:hypothetical protein [Desulfobacteraceae bacterium]